MSKPEVVRSHGNGVYPCQFGCLYDEYDNGRLRLTGDCRLPWSVNCYQVLAGAQGLLVLTEVERR